MTEPSIKRQNDNVRPEYQPDTAAGTEVRKDINRIKRHRNVS